MNPEEIKKIRLSLSMTQEEFAHFIGVTVGTMNRWESGVFKPSKLAIDKIKTLTNKQVKAT